ncbi:DNA-3-methyladenine glycosylase 2 family protein [bacterium]|jgi:DNA-3-methyladenine glycosylase II|nr:DNA-3-methyladenine glycosylase 2 family protein [bacterium]MBT5734729.1 DNA-3-methyladenine glycosylase 2 family protein [bacterium]MBT6019132.1 DNA-3-methyladenine glycosylase 2 family protein [bacterium]
MTNNVTLEEEVMIDGIKKLSSKDIRLKTFLQKFRVPVLPIEKNYFWSLCRSVIYQQISGKAAKKISDRYLSLFDQDVKMTPADVLEIDIEKIYKVGISRQKSSYIKNIADAFSNNIINEKKISELDDQEIIKQLTSIKGVGRWTAEMFLIFTLRRTDVFPVTDLGVQKGFQIFYSLDKLPTIKMMNQKSESWRPYRTIMSLYLWYAVEGPFEW